MTLHDESAIIRECARELGFDGMVLADALEMKAVSRDGRCIDSSS